jgi:hypothetical protein
MKQGLSHKNVPCIFLMGVCTFWQIKLWVRTPFMVRCTLYTTLCDKDCQWLVAGRWVSPGHPVSSTNKTDRQDIAEILLKMVLTLTVKCLYISRYSFPGIRSIARIDFNFKIDNWVLTIISMETHRPSDKVVSSKLRLSGIWTHNVSGGGH